MLIQCPSCHARAKISDEHEGAKVRCAECGRVYVARVAGTKSAAKGIDNGLLIAGFVGILIVIVIVALVRATGGEKPVPVAAPPAPVVKEAPRDLGWNSPAVRNVVAMHEAVFARDREKVKALLHGQRIWAKEHTLPDGTFDPSAPTFLALSLSEREAALERWAGELIEGPSRELVADWVPYGGQVTEINDQEASVRVDVKSRANAEKTRQLDWRLANDVGRFKVWSWQRWMTPEEAAAEERARPKGYEIVKRSDGRVVKEREPEPLGHLDDTPPELRERIDRLVATMLDLGLTVESGRAQRELIEIGKPALPALLTKLYEIPIDSDSNLIRCNLVDQALRDITGLQFGFVPGTASYGTAATEELRSSSIKQWFAWWYESGEKFTKKPEKPPPEDF